MTGQREPTHAGVLNAAAKIAAVLPPTPLLPIEVGGRTVWCKAESLQPVGAFKIRGAWHRLTDLTEAERAAGVVAFSSGNHAQGVAWAARRLGIAATIVMPHDAPAEKRAGTEALGATVVGYDRMTEDREAIAATLAAERAAVLVPSFDDPWVVEGQGSAGVEIAAQLGRQPDRIVACCGGGGLSSGLALACQDAEIVVVEPAGWDDVGRSLAAGRIEGVRPNQPSTACDALMTPRMAPLTFEILRRRGAVAVSVTEAEVARAMAVAFDRLRLVVEPGGAVALAAVLAGKVEIGEATVLTLSGGNVDRATFTRLTENAR